MWPTSFATYNIAWSPAGAKEGSRAGAHVYPVPTKDGFTAYTFDLRSSRFGGTYTDIGPESPEGLRSAAEAVRELIANRASEFAKIKSTQRTNPSAPLPGEVTVFFNHPGIKHDLRWVGLEVNAPQPIKDLLSATKTLVDSANRRD
jgi:hypothetical protein